MPSNTSSISAHVAGSPETRWILDCLRALASGDARPIPSETLDWCRVLAIAEGESLAPALGFLCKSGPPAGMPGDVRERLARALRRGMARHLFLSGELARVLESFERERIPVIPLKGLVLAENLYRHPGLRPSQDLDLLVRSEHGEAVADLLRRLGYDRVDEGPLLRFDRPYDAATLYQAPSGLFLDVHFTLLSEAGYWWDDRQGQSVWDRAVPIAVAGGPALGLCPEDLLLYLAMHVAVHHCVAGLLWLYDVFLLLERWGGTLGWAMLSERAGSWRVQTAICVVLREVEILFGARIPMMMIIAREPHGPRASMLKWMLRHRGRTATGVADSVIPLLLVDRGRDVVQTLSRVLLPPTDWLRCRYSDAANSRVTRYLVHYRRLGHAAQRFAESVRSQHR